MDNATGEYIKHVKSNIKGGVDISLGRRTLLVGPMGSGKSSVVQAIQIAADGALRDGEGREKIKEYSSLARSFQHGSRALFSTLILSNDTQRHWEIKKSGKTWKAGKPTQDFAVSFPFEDMKDILSRSDREVRSWLSGQILGAITMEDIRNVLPKDQVQEIEKVVQQERCTMDFNVIAAAAKKAATSIRRKATLKEKTVNQLTEGVSTPLSAADLKTLQARQSELSSVLAHTRERTQSDLNSLVAQKAMSEQTIQRGQAKLQALQAEATTGLSQEEYDFVSQLQAMLVLQVKMFGTSSCMVCRTTDIEEGLMEQVAMVEEGLALGTGNRKLLQSIERGLEIAVNRAKELSGEIAAFSITDLSAQRAELSQINDKLAVDVSSRRAWSNVRAANAEISAMRLAATHLVDASGTLQRVGKERLQQGLQAFEEEVNPFCPEGFRVGVDLDAGRVGFYKDDTPDVLHTSLSGGEWNAMVLALGCYSASKLTEGTVPVLTPDDRGWDPEGLLSVMRAVSDFSGQVIIMSTVGPLVWEDSGWTVCELGEQ